MNAKYKTAFAITAGAAGLAGIAYLLYRFKSEQDESDEENEGDNYVILETNENSESKSSSFASEENQESPVTENEFEIVNTQNTETSVLLADGAGQPVEADESQPLIKDNIAQKKVLVLGLDRAGKSCLLAAMANEDQPQLYEATPGFNVMCITANGMDLSIWEIGGECKYRGYWENFLKDTNLLIFVVDSTDNGRLEEVKDEISKVLKKEEMCDVPLLVVCTKQDRLIANKLTVDEISQELELSKVEDRQVLIRGVEVRCGGAAANKGLQELQDLITELCLAQDRREEAISL